MESLGITQDEWLAELEALTEHDAAGFSRGDIRERLGLTESQAGHWIRRAALAGKIACAGKAPRKALDGGLCRVTVWRRVK